MSSKQYKDASGEQIKPKETVSVGAVFFFLSFIFVIFASFLFYLRFSSFSPLTEYYAKIRAKDQIDLRTLFQNEIGKTGSRTKVEIKITDKDLATSLDLANSLYDLKKPEVFVKPEGIWLRGRSSDGFLGVKVEALIFPKVESGKVKYDIKEIKAAGVQAPPRIADSLKSRLAVIFSTALPTDKNFQITSITPMEGYLFVEGEKIQ